MPKHSSIPLVSLLLFVLPTITARGADPAADPADVSAEDRAFIATKMYEGISTYFAHLQGVPEFDLDNAYKVFLAEALPAPGRFEFDLACMAFVARLKNGHSGFFDPWINTQPYGKPLGFAADRIGNEWVVTRSRVQGLTAGDVIKEVGATDTEAYFQKKKHYLSASSERWARSIFFFQRYLFPPRFDLTLADGRTVSIDRSVPPDTTELKTEGRWLVEGAIAYVKIPSFDVPTFEQAVLEELKRFHDAKAIIIDIRGNGGGDTPRDLIRALMDRPYRGPTEATPQGVALVRLRGQEFDRAMRDPSATRDENPGYLQAMKDLSNNVQLMFPPQTHQPDKNHYKGRLAILIDRQVFSAGEDFCIPFKDNHRAILVGETTGGSTGQPYRVRFANGAGFRVSAKRTSFPDGSPFEGVGVAPDVDVPMTGKGVRRREDPVLEKAIELILDPK